MAQQSEAVTIAVLGLLNESPLHGYELRKRLDVIMGPLRRRISFGSLYPALRSLEARGLISQTEATAGTPPLAGRRARVVYHLTGAGEEELQSLLGSSGPAAWEDEQFDVHFAFFGRTEVDTRVRILQGRRTRVLERLERIRASMAVRDSRAARTDRADRPDGWAAELQRHTMESLERELRWLDGLIDRERGVVTAPLASTDRTDHPATRLVPGSPGEGAGHTSTTSEPTGELSTNQ